MSISSTCRTAGWEAAAGSFAALAHRVTVSSLSPVWHSAVRAEATVLRAWLLAGGQSHRSPGNHGKNRQLRA